MYRRFWQMARYMKTYPLREFVSHRFPLRDVAIADLPCALRTGRRGIALKHQK